MNTTLKVFIILITVMLIIFAGVNMTLYATRENWKRRWNEDTKELSQDLRTATQKLLNESAEKVKANNMVAMHEGRISDLQVDLKKQESTISEKDKEIQSLQLITSKLREDVAARDEKNSTLSNTLEQVRTRNTELQHIASVARGVAHQLNLKLAEVEDDLHNATTSLDKARQDIAVLTKDGNDNKARLALVRERHPKVWDEINDEKASHTFVQGVVAAVNTNPQGQQDLVMLTIGKDEGIEEGMEFIVFRGNQYVVKVRAEKVLNDMVACRVIPESWNAAGAMVQVNDLAQNRL
jgi:uncharacterized protein (DUF3084 family)